MFIYSEGVIDITGSTSCIEVSLDCSTQQVDIGCSGHVTTAGNILVTQSTTVGIAKNGSPTINVDVGIVFTTHFRFLCQWVIQSVLRISVHTQVEFRYRCSPRFQRLLVDDLTVLSAAIYLIYLSTVKQVHLGILCPGVLTESGSIDRCQITRGPVLPDRFGYVDLSIERTVGIVVTTIDIAVHRRFLTVIVDMRFVNVARNILIQTKTATKEVANLDSRTFWYVDHRTTNHTLIEAAAIDIAELAAYQVDDG